ncbi:MAG: group 1 truncated hemoglobin [Chloroflexi bacterium]|nr:group 1 truncated hemoglobin [Chloroflexota bacterium]
MEQFYDRAPADATLAHFFDPERMDGLKRQQRAFLSQALGGPANYSGKPLREAHAGLGITDEHFTAVAGHLAQTLAALGVPDELAGRVLEAVASLRSEVIQAD